MSESLISFSGVGKMYKIFPSRTDNLLDALGLAPILRREPRYREFWALRGIDLELGPGDRLGVIGRNGAGKSTLLKLVTGNFPATEGRVRVGGDVQALLEVGGGLHPEFTGRENIRAALAFMGLTAREIADAENEISDFTELGRFVDQPFKTYSQGMQARLSFAIATTVRPEILIIDEILGAGDAYFFGRSTARMRELIEGGAAVLLVSHALDQIIRFCDQAIWLDRGRIVMRGAAIEVVKAYERFVRELEDKRLLAKNRKLQSQADGFERESYTDRIEVLLTRPAEGLLEIGTVRLLRDGEAEDSLEVGDAQDADPSHSATLVLDGDTWSGPQREADTYFRRVVSDTGSGGPAAQAVFNLWFFYAESTYDVELTYRLRGGPTVATIRHEASGESATLELRDEPDWATARVRLPQRLPESTTRAGRPDPPELSRWPGEGTLRISGVALRDGEGREQAVFEAATPMHMVIAVTAERSGTYPVTPAATMYRSDGVLVSNHVGDACEFELERGEMLTVELDFGPINLGNGSYVFSVGLYRRLSHAEPSEVYDLLDRSYEIEIIGRGPFENGVFSHPGTWSVRRARRAVAAAPEVGKD
jgi:ABC-type polysaccharide/polyol phosphate transport system ATPase subunit